MVRQTRIAVPLVFLASFLFVGCSSNSQPASSGVTSSPPAVAPATAPGDHDNSKVCALFGPADAEKIMGAPMKLKPNRGQTVCMDEEVTALRNSIGTGTEALTLSR